MSFTARELMIDVLPARLRFAATAQLSPCGPAKAGTDDEEEDDIECSPATAGGSGSVCMAPDLTLLRHQLREALTLEQVARN